VTVFSLNGWQNETQFHVLDDKEERRVKLVCCGVECVVNVKELLASDVALLEPSEIIPCDGVLKSGRRSVDEDKVKVIPPSPALSTVFHPLQHIRSSSG